MFTVQVTSAAMKLLPVACLCLVTRCGLTSADQNGPTVVKVEQDRDVILPCSLSKENIELKLFDWKKAAEKDEKQKEVFFYDAGVHYNNGRSGQSEQFKGRVSHFPEELKHGNASIIITNTKMTDSGEYTCVFPRLQPRQTFHIKLVVGAAPEPFITILDETKDWSLLQCVVRGTSPKPKVEWQDSAGNKLPAGEPQITERGDSYDINLQTTVTKTDRYRCVVTQDEINHQTQAEIYVRFTESTPGWIIVAVVATFLCTVFVGVVLLAVLKYKGCITLKCNEDEKRRSLGDSSRSEQLQPPQTSPEV